MPKRDIPAYIEILKAGNILIDKLISKIISLEKSMYRQISEEMLNFLSGVKVFNNLIGEPSNKYRQNYKLMDHFRSVFYRNVENESQIERYIEYYKWIDSSLGNLLSQIVPASSQANTGLQNTIESHALERNKYHHKFPIIKSVPKVVIYEIEGAIENTNNTMELSQRNPEAKDDANSPAGRDGAAISRMATDQNKGAPPK